MKSVFWVFFLLLSVSWAWAENDNVVEWTQNFWSSLIEGGEPVLVAYPDGRYLLNGMKEIRWHDTTRPIGTDAVALMPKPSQKLETEGKLDLLAPITRHEEVTSAESEATGGNELKLLDIQPKKAGVKTEEILSFFQKTVNTPSGNEKSGTFVIPNQDQGLDRAPKSKAAFEIK